MLTKLRFWVPAGIALVLLLPGHSAADPLLLGHYELHNHPYGNARAPYYGLRLDGLLTGDPSDIYTFDFDHPLSSMWMDYTDDAVLGLQIRIHGTVWGGEDVGEVYDSPELWDVDFLYSMGLAPVPGDSGGVQDVERSLAPYLTGGNMGTITRQSDGNVFNLVDYSGKYTRTFRVGDTDTGLGHRGHPGVSGWGWLNHCNEDVETNCAEHLSASDWLFTAERVPEPGTLALFGIGSTLMLVRRRRKS